MHVTSQEGSSASLPSPHSAAESRGGGAPETPVRAVALLLVAEAMLAHKLLHTQTTFRILKPSMGHSFVAQAATGRGNLCVDMKAPELRCVGSSPLWRSDFSCQDLELELRE